MICSAVCHMKRHMTQKVHAIGEVSELQDPQGFEDKRLKHPRKQRTRSARLANSWSRNVTTAWSPLMAMDSMQYGAASAAQRMRMHAPDTRKAEKT